MLALEIERQYTKEEILRFYCNQVYMGHGRYGLEAAARYYFGKPARELTLLEGRHPGGPDPAPRRLSRRCAPRTWPVSGATTSCAVWSTSALCLTPEPARRPSRCRSFSLARDRQRADPAPYFVEEVRRWLQERYGSSSLYTARTRGPHDGRSTELQRDRQPGGRCTGCGELDKRQGWRGRRMARSEGEDPSTAGSLPDVEDRAGVGEVHEAVVVVEVDAEEASVRVGPHTGVLGQVHRLDEGEEPRKPWSRRGRPRSGPRRR